MTGPGWNKLIEPLQKKADEEGVKVLQIKEKFGGLRFYTERCSDELNTMINKAEDESYTICEYCGNSGSLQKGNWLKTLCNDCSDKRS